MRGAEQKRARASRSPPKGSAWDWQTALPPRRPRPSLMASPKSRGGTKPWPGCRGGVKNWGHPVLLQGTAGWEVPLFSELGNGQRRWRVERGHGRFVVPVGCLMGNTEHPVGYVASSSGERSGLQTMAWECAGWIVQKGLRVRQRPPEGPAKDKSKTQGETLREGCGRSPWRAVPGGGAREVERCMEICVQFSS